MSAIALPLTTTDCLGWFSRAAKPRPARTVSQWADAHRYLSGKQAGERGQWRTARTPFLREIMDCLSAGSPVTDIVVMKSSQVGVTEATVNWIGYVMEHAPAPMMVLMPTLEARDSWKTQKLNPLLQETPAVRDVLGGLRSRDAANRQDLIDFPGGVLFLAGGNSPNSYAQKSVSALLLDDLDRFPAEIGEEGDVVLLAKGRTKAFARAKRMFVSTPTVKDESLIEREWNKSDQRRYHIACPDCGHQQPLEFGGEDVPHGLKWNKVQNADGDAVVRDAWYVCRACLCEIREHQKPALLAAGQWIPAYPHRTIRGYHLNALYAPIGLGPSWTDLATEWLHAVASPSTLRAFVNTHLGEPWVEKGDQIEATGLIARVEDVPDTLQPLAVTAFVDVQKDRLEYSVVDWLAGEEIWVRDHVILPGDTAQLDVWQALAEDMTELAPDGLGIDCGYNTSMVYDFVKKRAWAYACKGMAGTNRPLVEDELTRRKKLRKKTKRGVPVHIVGVDQGKALLFARLKMQQPGPGYIHFPRAPAFDDEYFAQLTAEKLVTKIRGTRPVAEWVQTRPRNEALDCLVGNLAVLRLAGIDLAARAVREVPRVTPGAPRKRKPASSGGGRGFGRDDWNL